MTDPVFPGLHIRPPEGWVNDPNGVVRIDGTYHVFFQHNLDSTWHDAITWGHASSTDLLRWHGEPVAFRPRPGGPDRHGCWSGCEVTTRWPRRMLPPRCGVPEPRPGG